MKTVKQIKNKVNSLKRKLQNKTIYENFGDKEERQLEDFIGDVYQYPCENRQQIHTILTEFFNWRISYLGRTERQ